MDVVNPFIHNEIMMHNIDRSSYFSLLELEISPTIDHMLLESNYYKMQNQHHPDRFQDTALKAQALDTTQKLNKAFAVLADEVERRIYLLHLHGIDVADEKLVLNNNEKLLTSIFNLRDEIENANDKTQLHQLHCSITESMQKSIQHFDEQYFADVQNACVPHIIAAIFYKKLLREIHLKSSTFNANS